MGVVIGAGVWTPLPRPHLRDPPWAEVYSLSKSRAHSTFCSSSYAALLCLRATLLSLSSLHSLARASLRSIFVDCHPLALLCLQASLLRFTMSSRGGPPPRGIQREGYQREQEYTVLFVTPLPRDCSLQELRNHFGQYGVVNSVKVPQDHNTRQPKRYGFVGFLNPGHAASALLNLNCRRFRGQEITVQFATSRRKSALEMKARELVRSVTPLPSPTRNPSPEPRGNGHSRSPSISGSDLRRSTVDEQPFPAEGGRASPAGHDNHPGDGPQGVTGSSADESSVVRVELGDAWRGRACCGCGQVVCLWNDHHECSTEELSQDVIPRICVTLCAKRF